MHERQRMQYLDALGIDMFVPRVILPHSKAIEQCELPALADDAGTPATAYPEDSLPPEVTTSGTHASTRASVGIPDAGVAPRGDAQAAESIVSNILDRVDAPKTKSVKPEPKADIAQHEQAPTQAASVQPPVAEATAFSLSLWRIAPGVQVIDSRNVGEALPTHALLHNIVAAMKFSSSPLPGAEILNWPFPGAQDASWQAALQMVQGFFEARIIQQPTPKFWLMGESAYRVMTGDAEGYRERLYQEIPLQDFSASALILPSLAEILFDANLKRPVWLALQKVALS